MSCCGNKRDVAPRKTTSQVPPPSQKNSEVRKSSVKSGKSTTEIKAVKIFDVNNETPSQVATKGFKPVPQINVGNYGYKTKPQYYDQQQNVVHKSHLIGHAEELDFKLDDEFGVSNTFDIPTYDYQTLLNHSVLSRMNAKSKYEFDDGNQPVQKIQK